MAKNKSTTFGCLVSLKNTRQYVSSDNFLACYVTLYWIASDVVPFCGQHSSTYILRRALDDVLPCFMLKARRHNCCFFANQLTDSSRWTKKNSTTINEIMLYQNWTHLVKYYILQKVTKVNLYLEPINGFYSYSNILV